MLGLNQKKIKKMQRNFTVENHPQAGIRSDAEAGFASCMLLALETVYLGMGVKNPAREWWVGAGVSPSPWGSASQISWTGMPPSRVPQQSSAQPDDILDNDEGWPDNRWARVSPEPDQVRRS